MGELMAHIELLQNLGMDLVGLKLMIYLLPLDIMVQVGQITRQDYLLVDI
jgi:hypothetical protein